MIGKLKAIQFNDKVAYYSVVIFDDDDKLLSTNGSMFEDFRKNHESDNLKKLNYILDWINYIGDFEGALIDWFRFENDADALPPPTKIAKQLQDELDDYIEYDLVELTGFDLRLYCLRVSDCVVILFNGGIKTSNRAQDCPNVRRHFALANVLSKKINEAIMDNEIELSEDDILYDDDFEIIF